MNAANFTESDFGVESLFRRIGKRGMVSLIWPPASSCESSEIDRRDFFRVQRVYESVYDDILSHARRARNDEEALTGSITW